MGVVRIDIAPDDELQLAVGAKIHKGQKRRGHSWAVTGDINGGKEDSSIVADTVRLNDTEVLIREVFSVPGIE